jgi:ParB-like chromosome segregation protein Spo0J
MRSKKPASDRQNETYNQVSERETARNSKGGFRQLPLGRIRPNPHNARTHSAKQIRQIANSIAAFGFTNPLLVSEDIEVIAGHGRYEAAKLLGLPNAPVIIVPGLSPAKRRALAIADNKIPENAGWDRRRLAIEIPELTELLSLEELDISILGFEPIEIEQIRLEPEARRAGRAKRSARIMISTRHGARRRRSATPATFGFSTLTSCFAATPAPPTISSS